MRVGFIGGYSNTVILGYNEQKYHYLVGSSHLDGDFSRLQGTKFTKKINNKVKKGEKYFQTIVKNINIINLTSFN